MQTYPIIGHLQVADLEVVLHEFYEGHSRTYTCFYGYSRVYLGNQWARLRMRKVCYGYDKDHMEQVQRENMLAMEQIIRCMIVANDYHDLIQMFGLIKTHDVTMCLYLFQSLDEISFDVICTPSMHRKDDSVMYFLYYQGHVTTYVGFPIMSGMDEVILLCYHV